MPGRGTAMLGLDSAMLCSGEAMPVSGTNYNDVPSPCCGRHVLGNDRAVLGGGTVLVRRGGGMPGRGIAMFARRRALLEVAVPCSAQARLRLSVAQLC